jgi:hypothetical protein
MGRVKPHGDLRIRQPVSYSYNLVSDKVDRKAHNNFLVSLRRFCRTADVFRRTRHGIRACAPPQSRNPACDQSVTRRRRCRSGAKSERISCGICQIMRPSACPASDAEQPSAPEPERVSGRSAARASSPDRKEPPCGRRSSQRPTVRLCPGSRDRPALAASCLPDPENCG